MGAPTLIINGITLPQRARLDLQQTFERVQGGGESRRLANGGLFTMQRWRRWATTLSGSGWIPAPLLSLPIGEPFAVHSVAPLALRIGEPLPAGWAARTDWPEVAVTGELGVTVRLVYPILTVATLDGPRYMTGGDGPSWELNCEEV